MKCKCGNKLDVAIGARLRTKGCSVLTSSVCVVVVKCNKCGAIIQLPLNVGDKKSQAEKTKPTKLRNKKHKNSRTRHKPRKRIKEPEIRYIG